MMRMLSMLEIESGWEFEAKHVLGILNDADEGISLWPMDCVFTKFSSRRSRYSMACAGHRDRGETSVFMHFGLGLVRNTIMPW